MHKRTAHRWRLTAVLMAGAGFALGSFWMLQVMLGNEADMQAAARRNEPDFIVEKFSAVRMTPDGRPHYIFSGARLTHRPADDSSDVEAPTVNAYSPGQPTMTISARTARIEHGSNRVHLQGNVGVERPGAPGVQSLSLKTEALTILADEDKMETALAVDLKLGNSSVHGIGMTANNATRQLHVAREGQMALPPKAALR